jgi:hypothetical protein
MNASEDIITLEDMFGDYVEDPKHEPTPEEKVVAILENLYNNPYCAGQRPLDIYVVEYQGRIVCVDTKSVIEKYFS